MADGLRGVAEGASFRVFFLAHAPEELSEFAPHGEPGDILAVVSKDAPRALSNEAFATVDRWCDDQFVPGEPRPYVEVHEAPFYRIYTVARVR